jgi:hypothetical protein
MNGFIKVSETKQGKEEIAYFKSMIVNAKSGVKSEVDCPKCNGEGGITHYAHVQNGVCFSCKGTKKIFSYNHPNQQNKNRQFKERIELLESGYYVTSELIEEFCSIKEHQHVFFCNISESWFHAKMREQGLKYGQILNNYNYLINCNKNFMFE